MNSEEERKVLEIMDRALDSPKGLRLACKDSADAQRIRNSAYKIRKADRDTFGGMSRYDDLIFRISGADLLLIHGGSIFNYDIEEL